MFAIPNEVKANESIPPLQTRDMVCGGAHIGRIARAAN